jgi:ADP-ribosylglycohydrolase
MFGAVLGDIVGSPYERPSENILSKNFPLFSERLKFTDDTVMALAVTDVDILGER